MVMRSFWKLLLIIIYKSELKNCLLNMACKKSRSINQLSTVHGRVYHEPLNPLLYEINPFVRLNTTIQHKKLLLIAKNEKDTEKNKNETDLRHVSFCSDGKKKGPPSLISLFPFRPYSRNFIKKLSYFSLVLSKMSKIAQENCLKVGEFLREEGNFFVYTL